MIHDNKRIYSFDVLRIFATFCVLLVHAGLPYAHLQFKGIYIQPSTLYCGSFTYYILWLYMFTIYIFFFLAGYFSACTFQKHRLAGLAIERIKRVIVPFLIFWLIPAALSATAYIATPQPHITAGNDYLAHDPIATIDYIGSLWFLLYLAVMSLLTIVMIYIVRSTKVSISQKFFLWIVVCVCIVGATARLTIPSWFTPTTLNATIDIPLWFSYLSIYLFGYYTAYYKHILELIKKNCWYIIVIANVIIFPIFLLLFFRFNHINLWRALGNTIFFIGGWLATLGFIGVSLKYVNRTNSIINYLRDASYWIYLSQIPFVFFTQSIAQNYLQLLTAKYIFTFTISLILCLLSYQVFIRNRKYAKYIDGKQKLFIKQSS